MVIATKDTRSIWSSPTDRSETLYIPFWHPSYGSNPASYISKDKNAVSIARTGGVWGKYGWTADGDDYMDAANASGVAAITGDMTIAIWLNFSNTTGDQTWVSTRQGLNDVTVPYHIWAQNDIFDFRMGNGTAQEIARYQTTPSTGVWYFMVGTISGTAMTVYLYNTSGLMGSGTDTFSGTRQTGTKLTIGAADTAALRPCYGTIGEVWILTRAWSAGEVARIQQRTKWRYKS